MTKFIAKCAVCGKLFSCNGGPDFNKKDPILDPERVVKADRSFASLFCPISHDLFCTCGECHLHQLFRSFGIEYLENLIKEKGYIYHPCTGTKYSIEDIEKIVLLREI